MTDVYQVKCTGCQCWRGCDSGFKKDKLGRLNKTCYKCVERTRRKVKRNPVCEHGSQKHLCKYCGGTSLCEHGRQHNKCVPCGGAGVCIHKRLRYRCALCKVVYATSPPVPTSPPSPPIDWSEFAETLAELDL